jgi:CubicO group peptidase (beta-lactamase class C family)
MVSEPAATDGDRATGENGRVIDSVGQFGWSGAASTRVFIDPIEEMVIVMLAQDMPVDTNFLALAQTLAYQAIVDGKSQRV